MHANATGARDVALQASQLCRRRFLPAVALPAFFRLSVRAESRVDFFGDLFRDFVADFLGDLLNDFRANALPRAFFPGVFFRVVFFRVVFFRVVFLRGDSVRDALFPDSSLAELCPEAVRATAMLSTRFG
jgi:hypothetical protein